MIKNYFKNIKYGIKNLYKWFSIICKDQCTWEEEKEGLLQTIFKDGVLVKTTTLNEIRELLNNQIN